MLKTVQMLSSGTFPECCYALIATEDARYYDHSGVDIFSLGRAISGPLLGRANAGGGSTITQQLAKMLFPREDNIGKFHLVIKKIKEWVVAVKLEREYTKEEIIAMYLNKFDYVNNAVGINQQQRSILELHRTLSILSRQRCLWEWQKIPPILIRIVS